MLVNYDLIPVTDKEFLTEQACTHNLEVTSSMEELPTILVLAIANGRW